MASREQEGTVLIEIMKCIFLHGKMMYQICCGYNEEWLMFAFKSQCGLNNPAFSMYVLQITTSERDSFVKEGDYVVN